VFEFELSRSAPRKGRGPGSRLLFLKKAIAYFRDDRDAWKRQALYCEKHVERAEKQLLEDVERFLPDPPPEQPRGRTSRRK
jgi:hypothetical protein